MSRNQIIASVIAVLVIVAVILGFIFRNSLFQSKTLADGVREELFSAPLQVFGPKINGTLTQSGVIELTNNARSQNGATPLAENAQLDLAAKNKLDDMFTQQYFDHISPQGNGPGYVVSQAGYNYLVVGENLAMGGFANDTDLVNAWMASPGHRANILNHDFVDIGVAVGQGTYQGKTVWIAVQEFGRPASVCPSVDASLKTKIGLDESSLASLNSELTADHQQLSTMPQNTAEEEQAYNQKVQNYNALLTTYNSDQAALKQEVASYNDEVEAFNACLAK